MTAAANPVRAFTFDGQRFDIFEMLAANAGDTEMCAWIESAAVGDVLDGCERVA